MNVMIHPSPFTAMVMDPSKWEQQGEEAEVMFLLGALFSPSAIFLD